MNYCDNIQCLNGGTCKELQNEFWPFKCECLGSYAGQFCEIGNEIKPFLEIDMDIFHIGPLLRLIDSNES